VKKGIHPVYVDAIARCVCGQTMALRSVQREIRVEACSRCHPAYTGRQAPVAREGRIAWFKRKYGGASAPEAAIAAR
jgi:large subunit ribosomal protein L31